MNAYFVSLHLEEVSTGRFSNYFIVVSVTRGVGQVVLDRAVAVVAVEEAEVGLAARKIHNYSARCSARSVAARGLS